MNKSIKGVVWALCCALGAASLSGCGAADSPAKPSDEAMATMSEELTSTGSTGGDGFVCGPTADGGTGCVCWEGDTSPIYSCDGMMTFCDTIGPGMTCNPFDHTCSCRTWVVTTTAPIPKTRVIVGTTASTSKLAAP